MSIHRPGPPPPGAPLTEADLQAWVDGQLPPHQAHEMAAYLSAHPEEARRADDYRAQKRALRALFDPVVDESVPQRLRRAAQPAAATSPRRWLEERWVAGIAIALVSGATGWGLHAQWPDSGPGGAPLRVASPAWPDPAEPTPGFAQRAAVAHAVYSPDTRRPVEVDAAHQDQLVAWLSKRMGAPMKPPLLQAQGYALDGGRLLPGGQGPVAQFMYSNALGGKLTLYVSNHLQDLGSAQPRRGVTPAPDSTPATPQTGATEVAFRFVREGAINVFYWVDGPFGYALSADVDRDVLARVSAEVYAQLAAPTR